MPIFIIPGGPGSEPPEQPDQAVSTDGRLRATLLGEAAHNLVFCAPSCERRSIYNRTPGHQPGIFLEANFSGSPNPWDTGETDPAGWPMQVRFVRVTPDGEIPVRSGHDAWAVGGIAHAFDAEAPLDQAHSYRAYPIFSGQYATVPGEPDWDHPSGAVSLYQPGPIPGDGGDCWITPVLDPALAIRVTMIEPLPTFSYASRTTLAQIQGSPYQVGSYDTHLAYETSFTFWTPDLVDRDRLLTTLDAGPALLRSRPEYGLGEAYVLFGDLEESPMESDLTDPGRTWTVPVVQVAKPATEDNAMVVPGRAYADIAEVAPTYSVRESLFPVYADATHPPSIPWESPWKPTPMDAPA